MDLEREQADLVRRMEPVRRVALRVAFALAVIIAVYGAARWWYDARVFARMRETTCTLVIKQVDLKLRTYGTGGRSSRPRVRYDYDAQLVFTHTLAGEKYRYTAHLTGRDDPAARFQEGQGYPCRYDPVKPSRVTLESSFQPDLDSFWVSGALLALGVVLTLRAPR